MIGRDMRQVLVYAYPYRRQLIMSSLLMLVESMAVLALPWLGGKLVGKLLSGGGLDALLMALLVLLLAQAALKAASGLILGNSAERVVADLRSRVYDHIQSLPMGFHQQHRKGETLSLLVHDLDTLGAFVTGTLPGLFPLLVTALGALGFMLTIDPLLSVLGALLIPLFFLLIKIVGRRLRPISSAYQQAYSSLFAVADENLDMLPAIKAFTREAHESARIREQNHQIVQLNVRRLRLQTLLGPGVQLLAGVSVLLMLWLAGERIAGGNLGTEQLATFLLYVVVLTRPVAALSSVYGQSQATRGALERLLGVLGQPGEEDVQPVGDSEPPPVLHGRIVFKDVQFTYPGRPPAIKQLSFVIEAGEVVAVTGPNGAGKSTLGHLLMRIYEPDAGQILIDGIDIRRISLRELRRNIAVVHQHVLLFNASVHDNIAYSKPGASRQEVEQVARLAQAHEFVMAMPQAYDTIVGDRGLRLSGGQRQRIALARAFLKDAPILVLDEATSMFDPTAEARFLSDCHELLRGRTVLLITHRPASLAIADRQLVLREGQLELS